MDVNGAINSSSEYRLSGKTVFRVGDLAFGLYRNTYAGDSAGFSNTTGFANTFIGGGAGILNAGGYRNCFLGSLAGNKNTSGQDNTYIGSSAGTRNSTGAQNTFVGSGAGFNNETGYNNTFLGLSSGSATTGGIQNTFLGSSVGIANLTGSNNVFIGQSAGETNATGHNNTLLGAFSDLGSSSLSNATAIGYTAYVTQSNSLVLGSINGVNGATADTRVGIGTTAPTEKLDIVGNVKVNGEVNHPSTGTSNLLPIAYGNITGTGIINSGSGNFTVIRLSAGFYDITIANHPYFVDTYTTLVTPFNNPIVGAVTSFGGDLRVRLFNLSGVLTDNTFHFVVYKQ